MASHITYRQKQERTGISQMLFVATELEEFDGTKTSTEKSSSQCYHNESPHELSSKGNFLDSIKLMMSVFRFPKFI